MNTLPISDIILHSLIPGGQLFARINNYNGSLHNWWLLLLIPFTLPLNFISAIPVSISIIISYIINLLSIILLPITDTKPNSSPLSLIDYNILWPIVLKLYLSLLSINTGFKYSLNIIFFIIIVFFGAIINSIKIGKLCNSDNIIHNILKSIYSSIINYNIGSLLSAILLLIFPNEDTSINSYRKSIEKSIYWTIGYTISYIINNMIIQNDINTYCSRPPFDNIREILTLIGSILLIINLKFPLLNIFNTNYDISKS